MNPDHAKMGTNTSNNKTPEDCKYGDDEMTRFHSNFARELQQIDL